MIQSIYIPALVFAVTAGTWVTYAAWTRRDVTGATALGAMALAAVVWAGGTLGLVGATTPAAELRWLQFSYFGIVTAPVAFFVFAVRYTGYWRALPAAVPAVLGVLGAGFLALVWTNPRHQSYWAEIDYAAAVPEGIATTPGPGFWAFVVFTYALLLVGSALLVRYALGAPDLYRRQVGAILLGVAAPWTANVPHALQVMTADFTPVALSVTVLAFWVALFRYRLSDIGPIALRTVFESMPSGVFVLDHRGQVLELNRAGMNLFGVGPEAVGESFDAVVPDQTVAEYARAGDGTRDVFEIEQPDSGSTGHRYLAVRVTPIERSRGRHDGRVVHVTDVTDTQRQQRRLRAQNDRLDQFASVVSHDLRNPLHVAEARVELAREECESEHLERASEAHQRIETLIDELLALSRHGEEMAEPETVSLQACIDDCWRTVETSDATLETDGDRQLRADPSRFRQLLENLLRNAIEHGGEDVTVRVGDLPDGFYVADDGPGIPDEESADIFEAGYSTGGGTGLGLAIVDQVVAAHGWEITATESRSGGARFEVTGVETSP